MDRLGDAQGMAGPVEKVGVGEGHMRRAHRHELGHIANDNLFGHDAKPAVVDDGQRAVLATMRAAVARLDSAGQSLLAAQHEPRIALQRRQQIAGRREEGTAAQVHDHLPVGVGRDRLVVPARPFEKGGFVLPDDHPVNNASGQSAAHGGVKAVQAHRQVGTPR